MHEILTTDPCTILFLRLYNSFFFISIKFVNKKDLARGEISSECLLSGLSISAGRIRRSGFLYVALHCVDLPLALCLSLGRARLHGDRYSPPDGRAARATQHRH